MTNASETPTPDADEQAEDQSNPMFYRAPTVLRKDAHSDLAISQQNGFGFAKGANVIPIMAAELPQAIRSYPVVFSGPTNMPLAVTGLKASENLFVDEDGNWAAGHYIPAYVRRYPFVLAGEDTDETLTLCLDMEAPALAKRGDEGATAMFDEAGEASDLTKNALRFCEEYQVMYGATRKLSDEIVAKELLMEQRSEVTLPDGSNHSITGFKGIDEAKLNELSDEAFLELRATGALGAIYCQLASTNTWQSLLARK